MRQIHNDGYVNHHIENILLLRVLCVATAVYFIGFIINLLLISEEMSGKKGKSKGASADGDSGEASGGGKGAGTSVKVSKYLYIDIYIVLIYFLFDFNRFDISFVKSNRKH